MLLVSSSIISRGLIFLLRKSITHVTNWTRHFFHQIFIEHLQGTGSVPGTTDTNLNKTLSLQKKFDKFDHLKEKLLKNISRDKSQIEIQITDKSKS